MLSRGPRWGQGGPGVGLARSSLLSARRLWTPRATPYPEDTLRSPPWWAPTCTPRAHPGPPRCPWAGRAGRSSGREGAAPSWPPVPAEHPARGRPREGPRGPVVVPVPRCLRPPETPRCRGQLRGRRGRADRVGAGRPAPLDQLHCRPVSENQLLPRWVSVGRSSSIPVIPVLTSALRSPGASLARPQSGLSAAAFRACWRALSRRPQPRACCRVRRGPLLASSDL